jgi:hypothetical protein
MTSPNAKAQALTFTLNSIAFSGITMKLGAKNKLKEKNS